MGERINPDKLKREKKKDFGKKIKDKKNTDFIAPSLQRLQSCSWVFV